MGRNNLLQWVSSILLWCFITVGTVSASATIKVGVSVQVNDSVEIKHCDLCVSDSTRVVYFVKLQQDYLELKLEREGTYSFLITCGLDVIVDNIFTLECDTIVNLTQQHHAINLGEILVTANSRPKVTATGQIFRLSEKAKKSGNPFRALSEIPLLNVDISGQTVRTNEGDTPLVLIDGKSVNSGIAPIDPKFIEAVEITEVVNAKYLQLGVSKIIDIRLKREVPLYSYVDLRTRHDLPVREGFGAVSFEIGKPIFAVSGSMSGDYLFNEKVNSSITETSGEDSRFLNNTDRTRQLGYEGELLLKWMPRSSEYFAGVVKKRMSYNRKKGTGQGNYNQLNYSTIEHNNQDEGGWLGALYYEHSFHDNSLLSVFAKYNKGVDDVEEKRQDDISGFGDDTVTEYQECEESYRDQYTLTIDYNGTDHDYGNLSGGYNFEYTHDTNYNNSVTPREKNNVNLANNYSYISYSNMWQSLFFMGSVGLQYMQIRTDQGNNSWWRPRAVATFGLRLPKSNLLRAIYEMDNELPLSSQLSTFNHSTNPWLRIEGNPYLVPMEKHAVTLMYDKTLSHFNMRLYSQYHKHLNMIEQYVSNEENFSIQSYRNNGSWQNFKIGGIFSFQKGNVRATFKCAYQLEKYNSMQSHGIIELGGNFRWDFHNFFIYSDIEWRNQSYTAISKTKYVNPSIAHVQIAWQATPSLYLSIGMPYFWGIRKENSMIAQGNYSMIKNIQYKSSSLHPWILISWTIRKNTNQSIDDRMPAY